MLLSKVQCRTGTSGAGQETRPTILFTSGKTKWHWTLRLRAPLGRAVRILYESSKGRAARPAQGTALPHKKLPTYVLAASNT